MSRRAPARLPGHKLTIEFSGERSRAERSSTGYCICGWTESASVQSEVRFEYRMHIKNELEKLARYRATEPEKPKALAEVLDELIADAENLYPKNPDVLDGINAVIDLIAARREALDA